MFTALELFENEAGRWEWVIIAMEGNSMRGKLGISAISFRQKVDAEVDGKQHLEAEIGVDGRPVRSKEDLRRLIKLIASDCSDCDDSYFGGIYWHERDEFGCNWSVSMVSGPDWSGCFDCVQPAATRLRQTYNIADEG